MGVYCRSCGFWWAANMGCTMAEAYVAYRKFYGIEIADGECLPCGERPMTWPDFLQALRRYGFRASAQEGYVAVRGLTEVAPELPYRIEWGFDGAPVRVFQGFLGSELDRPAVYEGTPGAVLAWAETTYPRMEAA